MKKKKKSAISNVLEPIPPLYNTICVSRVRIRSEIKEVGNLKSHLNGRRKWLKINEKNVRHAWSWIVRIDSV